MAIKAFLKSLEGVPETLQKEYTPGEGGFFLQVEGLDEGTGHPAVGALVRAKGHEAKARQAAETRAKEIAAAHAALQQEMEDRLSGALPKSDVEALKKNWEAKLLKQQTEGQAKFNSSQTALQRLLVDNVAQTVAARIARDAKVIPLLLPHIKARLTADLSGDEAATLVLDSAGKPSAMSVEDLLKEFLANPAFADVVIGSKASGGGAEGAHEAGGAPGVRVDFNKSPAEIVAAMKARKAANGG